MEIILRNVILVFVVHFEICLKVDVTRILGGEKFAELVSSGRVSWLAPKCKSLIKCIVNYLVNKI